MSSVVSRNFANVGGRNAYNLWVPIPPPRYFEFPNNGNSNTSSSKVFYDGILLILMPVQSSLLINICISMLLL